METYDVGYVPNLSERIGAVKAVGSASHPVYFGQPNDVQTFRAAYQNYSWFALSFAFSRQFSGDWNLFTYAGFSVNAPEQWTGNFQWYTHPWAGTLISDWDFEIYLQQAQITECAFTFVAVYETTAGTVALAEGFEPIDI